MPYSERRGGVRIPTEETLRQYNIKLSKTEKKLIQLIRHRIPKMAKVFAADVRKLERIGRGDFQKGFYHVLRLAHECHITGPELNRLKKAAGTSDAHEALLIAIDNLEAKE